VGIANSPGNEFLVGKLGALPEFLDIFEEVVETQVLGTEAR
jgi:hypothetical protein